MDWSTYHRTTRTATYGFLSALPLVVMYEAMIIAVNQGRVGQVRVGADVWLKGLLALIGGTGFLVLGIVVVGVGVVIFFMERDEDIPLRGRYFAWMVGESAVYALCVALTVSSVVGMIFMTVPPQDAVGGWWTRLALSIGAGVYEELVFRVLLVGGLFALLRRLLGNTLTAYGVAAVLGAALFSAVHYVGTFGDVFTPASFTFRFLFGLALNGLFLWRGFGIAAWTHALYDVMLVVSGLA
jgi:hypothetical protein